MKFPNSVFPALFAALMLTGLSCSKDGITNPYVSPDGGRPTVTGLYITGPDGPDVLGVWGAPSDGSASVGAMAVPRLPSPSASRFKARKVNSIVPGGTVPSETAMRFPYPNPLFPSTKVQIDLTEQSPVELWLIAARTPQQAREEDAAKHGVIAPAPEQPAVIFSGTVAAGSYLFDLTMADSAGRGAPSGFYRIYAHLGKRIYWHDVGVFRSPNEMPPDLRAALASITVPR